MGARVYDPIPADHPMRVDMPSISLDHATRMRAALATHVRVRNGMSWPDALTATSVDFYPSWFPPGCTVRGVLV